MSERIRELIKIEGSASAIANRCGFSTGTVRNWRDGRSDISRERCITMARELDVSLLWLITGEGPVKMAPENFVQRSALRPDGSAPTPGVAHSLRLDPDLLAASLRMMQSYMALIGGSLDPHTRAAGTAELYEILSQCGETAHINRLMDFHKTLRDQLRHDRTLIG